MIRHWRRARGLSQMALALDTHVSPRHLSFVETGRSRPSRALLVRLADRLAIPGREQNAILERAGYARRFRERAWDDPDLDHVRSVLRFLLERHEPHSALVFDAHWNIVMSNRAHRRALAFFLEDAPPEVEANLLRLTAHPRGLRPWIVNRDVVVPGLLRSAERALSEAPSDHRLADLLAEVKGYPGLPRAGGGDQTTHPLLLPLHLRKGALEVRLFSVVSTIGTATDVTLQSLRLESFFPADSASEAALATLRD